MADDDRAAILAVEDRRCAALIAVDMPALDALFAADLIHVHSTGLVHDKPRLLRHIEANRAYVSIERRALIVRSYDATAILTGAMTSHMRRGAGEIAMLDGMVTQVLRREDGIWRFVSFQFTLGTG